MTISANLEHFAGLEVEDFDPAQGVRRGADRAWRLRLDYDAYSAGQTMAGRVEELLADPGAPEIQALLIGAWDFESSTDAATWLPALCAGASRLPRLRALMLGDITFEEQEISWIKQSNVGPVLPAFGTLEVLQVRGGDGLDLDPLRHDRLKSLTIETGGLPKVVLERLASAHLPALEELELWLGSSSYGWDASVTDLGPILRGDLFPRLRRLGLRDSEEADAVAAALVGAPVLDRLEELDLSLGTLGEAGVQALLREPRLRRLRRLDVHHNYLTDDGVARLMALGIEVDASDQQTADEGERYCAVGE